MTLIRSRHLLAAAACALAVGALTGASAQEKKADAEAGELAFNNACRTCHTVKAGDNRLGPHLHDIIGRKAGTAEGYPYSDSMKNSGVVWDEKTLDAFIENPDAVVTGNNMKPYTGMTNAEERAKIVAFLKSKSKS